jgi:hypothetical protein
LMKFQHSRINVTKLPMEIKQKGTHNIKRWWVNGQNSRINTSMLRLNLSNPRCKHGEAKMNFTISERTSTHSTMNSRDISGILSTIDKTKQEFRLRPKTWRKSTMTE